MSVHSISAPHGAPPVERSFLKERVNSTKTPRLGARLIYIERVNYENKYS